jgi:DNA-binding NarL/FixJ family response regulator
MKACKGCGTELERRRGESLRAFRERIYCRWDCMRLAPQNTKLTPHEVRAIRQAVADGNRSMDVAKLFKISPTTVSHICSRVRWAHVD